MNRSEFRHPQIRKLFDYLVEVRENLRDELVRVDVVATVADLPAEAPLTRWFRVANPAAERVNVYIGNGPGRPLSRITTTPV